MSLRVSHRHPKINTSVQVAWNGGTRRGIVWAAGPDPMSVWCVFEPETDGGQPSTLLVKMPNRREEAMGVKPMVVPS